MRQRHKELSRDERNEVLTLHLAGFKYKQIQDFFQQKKGKEVTSRQIQWAIEHGHPTPQKKGHCGAKRFLSEEDVDKIELFVVHSKTNRLLSYQSLAHILELNVSADVIKDALGRRGYKRYIAMAKPPISEKNRQLRLAWAREHENWTMRDWCMILWTDETWVTGGRHRRKWVTRKIGEELHPDCVLKKVKKKTGWMFWGCFWGATKGPGIFWEKAWGTIGMVSLVDY